MNLSHGINHEMSLGKANKEMSHKIGKLESLFKDINNWNNHRQQDVVLKKEIIEDSLEVTKVFYERIDTPFNEKIIEIIGI